MPCFQCKKRNQENKCNCGHSMCNKCLSRSLLLNEFRGLNNATMSIEFKCKCLKGTLSLSTAQYITILNSLLVDPVKHLDLSSQDVNMSDELSSKLHRSVKKKKKSLMQKTFEDFTLFINSLESKLMNTFKWEIKDTIEKLNKITASIEEGRKKFLEKMNLKMTKLNSMFVIIKMVYFNLYKDFDNMTDMTILDYLSQLSCELIQIDFKPNVERLEKIKEEVILFNNEDHLKCVFVFQSTPEAIADWKQRKIITVKPESLIASIVQIDNGIIASSSLSDYLINVWDIRSNATTPIYTLYPHVNIIKQMIYISYETLIACCSKEIKIWSTKTKEVTYNLEINNETSQLVNSCEFISICEIQRQKIAIGINDFSVKVFDLKSKIFIAILTCDSKPYVMILNPKNSNLICGLEKGDIIFFDMKIYQNSSQRYSIGDYNINTLLEWKGKIIIGSNYKDIKVIDIKEKKETSCLKGHSKGVINMILFAHKLLITSSLDFELRVWDLNKMKCSFILSQNQGCISTMIPLFYGQFATGGMNSQIIIWNYE